MKSDNVIQEKSFKFAVRAVNLYKYLIESKKEYVLSKQLLRSATSIGANVEEAIGAQSKPDFLSKMGIAYKEAESLLIDVEELLKIIGKIQISTKHS